MSDIKRKLASVQTVKELKPIEGADLIELATFSSVGWQCVVGKKDNLQPGDRVIYFEVDSVLDINDPRFNFLEPVKGRIKTRRFKGIYSQGLALPLTAFPEVLLGNSLSEHRRLTIQLPDGYDVTDILKVIKYEIPEFSSTAGDLKGAFPGFAEKSDEERCISEGTPILTDKGPIKIEELKSSFRVLTYNEETRELTFEKVLKISSLPPVVEDWYKITLDNGESLLVTDNHRLFLPNLNCYRLARDLNLSDVLLLIDKEDIHGEISK